MRIVPAFNEAEDRHASVGLRREGAAIKQLTLERGKELSHSALS